MYKKRVERERARQEQKEARSLGRVELSADDAESFMRGEDVDAAALEKADTIEVLEPNWWVVQTYRRCSWKIDMGFVGGGFSAPQQYEVYREIETHVILSAAQLVGAPRKDWMKIVDGIRWIMVPVARPILNDIAAARLKNGRLNR